MRSPFFIATALLLGACDAAATGPVETADLEGSGYRIAVAASEFGTTGSLAFVDGVSLEARSNFSTLHHDTVLRADGTTLYAIAREGEDGDNVRRIDLATGGATVWQYSVGRGSNPWDLLVLDDRFGLVVRYSSGDLVRVDLGARDPDSFVVGEPIVIDPAEERDGRAEPAGLIADGERIYVIVQGLDEYPWCTAGARARIVALHRETLEPATEWASAGTLPLRLCNPGSWSLDGQGRLLIGFAGNSRVLGAELDHPAGDDDGGLELVDLAAGVSLGQIASESDFGGRDLVDLAVDSRGGVWLALADVSFEVSVHRWSAVSGAGDALSEPVWVAEGIFDIEAAEGRLWIADRTPRAEGVVVLDESDGSWIAGPIDVGHPPFDLEPLGPAVTGP